MVTLGKQVDDVDACIVQRGRECVSIESRSNAWDVGRSMEVQVDLTQAQTRH
jgi:hypothetical protein